MNDSPKGSQLGTDHRREEAGIAKIHTDTALGSTGMAVAENGTTLTTRPQPLLIEYGTGHLVFNPSLAPLILLASSQ